MDRPRSLLRTEWFPAHELELMPQLLSLHFARVLRFYTVPVSKDISNGILRLGRTGNLKTFDRWPLLKPMGRAGQYPGSRLDGDLIRRNAERHR